MNNNNSMWKNYGLWVALSSMIFLILERFNVISYDSEWQKTIDSILFALVTAGVLSNPQSGFGFINKPSVDIDEYTRL